MDLKPLIMLFSHILFLLLSVIICAEAIAEAELQLRGKAIQLSARDTNKL